ncbi:MAG: hypothetical protein ACRYGC_05775 [Janthinobacterium lividum]
MSHRLSPRVALLAATAIAWCCGTNGEARAADDPRLGAIEAQIRALQTQLGQVRHDLAARDAQVRSARAEAAQARADARAVAGTGSRVAAGSQGGTRGRGDALAQDPSGPGGMPSGGGAGPGGQGRPARLAARPGEGGEFGATGAGNGVNLNTPGSIGQQQAATSGGPLGTFKVGNATVSFGGFVALESVLRSRNETADIGSTYIGIPEGQSQAAHEHEFRFSARQSRVSLLVADDPTPQAHLAAYLEADFLGAAPTANSLESDSYTPRLRQYYATFDGRESGLHVLAGQSWSLLTLNKVGITPRQEDIPLSIDAQYVPGFNWARQPQLRIAKDFDDHRIWLAASVEGSQTSYYQGPNGSGSSEGTVNVNNPGGSGFYSGNTYSDEIAPDVIVKAAFDPGWGHFEAYGLARFLHDRVSVAGSGHSSTVLAGGGGAGMILPLVKGRLDFQASGLAGYGIGRYGSGQMPDATTSATGEPSPLAEFQVLVGLVGHPAKDFDLYGYAGTEQVGRNAFAAGGKGYGYGSPLYANGGCGVELSAAATCVANTSGITQGTLGGWWRFYHGGFGTVQAGVQYSYTRRDIFSGTGGSTGTNENMVFTSLRFSPFQ